MLNDLFIKNSRIEICGGIASGKTTLASLMKNIGINPIYENFQVNPFLEFFYLYPDKYTFETEISFLLQHYHQIKKDQIETKINICDYSFLLDIAYANMGLNDTKLTAFFTIYNEIMKELSPPLFIIYLNCDANTQLERINNRERNIEKQIDINFLKILNDNLDKQIRILSNKMDIISIDSKKYNFADDKIVKQEIVNYILNITSNKTSIGIENI